MTKRTRRNHSPVQGEGGSCRHERRKKAENVDLILVGSTRAGDIVRDADILHLYKKAGWVRFLLGLESTDEATLARIRKGATASVDREAIRLTRQHGILSMATWAIGLSEETDRDHSRGLRQLLSYDPDQIQMIYATPHRWTPYFREAAGRQVIQTDQRRWDYKHQVLANRHLVTFAMFISLRRVKHLLRYYLEGYVVAPPRYANLGSHVLL